MEIFSRKRQKFWFPDVTTAIILTVLSPICPFNELFLSTELCPWKVKISPLITWIESSEIALFLPFILGLIPLKHFLGIGWTKIEILNLRILYT